MQTRGDFFYRENMTSFLDYVRTMLRALFAWRGSYVSPCDIFIADSQPLNKLMLSNVENPHRLVNELDERVTNLDALSENTKVADIQNRYDRVRNRARVSVAIRAETSFQISMQFLSKVYYDILIWQ